VPRPLLLHSLQVAGVLLLPLLIGACCRCLLVRLLSHRAYEAQRCQHASFQLNAFLHCPVLQVGLQATM
jgi:hypothetical protein